MRNSQRENPAGLTPSWPDAKSSDHAGEVARLLAKALQQAVGDRSVRSVASAAGLDEGTLRRILAGERWPDVRTAALLEEALQKPLYPRWSMEWRV